jgi:mRNA interferase RelE/StbE
MIRPAGYLVRIKRSAEREMDRLPRQVFDRVAAAILALENDPRPRGFKKLRGTDESRLRVGDYRILYTIDDAQRVVAVGHRRDVYRGL